MSKTSTLKKCLVSFQNAKFKKDTLSKTPYIYPNPISNINIYPANVQNGSSMWAVTGNSKTTMLKIIAGEYISYPPLSRQYPLINDRPTQLQFLNFRDGSGLDKVHMSARYETYSYKGVLEMSDDHTSISKEFVNELLDYFKLQHLKHKWINSLSNGQLRRARIAKSLINKPKLLIIDDPFLGLDPINTQGVSEALKTVSEELDTSIVLGLRVQDDIPDWINSLCYVDESGVKLSGNKSEILNEYNELVSQITTTHKSHVSQNDIHIEFQNASVTYKQLVIFDDFNWKIPRGSKWRILGDNGTGKTTLLSIITADHPQSWKSVIKVNGILRKTGSGVTFFDINNKIGISSPELHALVPQHNKTMKDIIYNGLVKNVGNSNFYFKGDPNNITAGGQKYLQYFADRIDKYGDTIFNELSLTDQKLALFLRAIIKEPELLILDEAFSCMDDENVMIKCHELIEKELNDTTVISIGHLEWELCKYDYMIQLINDNNGRDYKTFKINWEMA
ncbi:ABC transporter family protein [Candida albicans]|uniref:ABC transporter family protein n=1 Tax=Candida albicans TaxID=5476 RepID=A0A8H6C1H9_CANAX|nr:ABC transporter family protein [Candida albicans]